MSDLSIGRRTKVKILIAGVDITEEISQRLKSIQYTDCEDDSSDDLQIVLEDADFVWLTKYLNPIINAAASTDTKEYANKGLRIQAVFVRENWNGDGKDKVLDTGECALDEVVCSGSPNILTLKATSLPRDTAVSQTKKCQAWEAYYLSRIAKEIAERAGMTCMFESTNDPFYNRAEQVCQADIAFLQALCHRAGISLKVTANMIVLFDQAKYEAANAVITFSPGSGYTSYRFTTGQYDTQYSACKISYTDPGTKVTYSGKYTDPDFEGEAQILSLNMKVGSNAEAVALAKKMLRLKNKFERKCEFSLPGNPSLIAGITVMLKGWGMFDGKYIIAKSVHSVSGGYTTKITLRRVLEGY